MRLELLFTWRRRDTAALLGLYALGALGAVVPGLRGWLGIFSPENLVYYLPAAALMVVLDLWRPSREARMHQLYAALPVTRLDVLAARSLLLAAGRVEDAQDVGQQHAAHADQHHEEAHPPQGGDVGVHLHKAEDDGDDGAGDRRAGEGRDGRPQDEGTGRDPVAGPPPRGQDEGNPGRQAHA